MESLVLEIEPKAEELNRVVKGLIQAIREKQESRLLRQLDRGEGRKKQSPCGGRRRSEGVNHSFEQEQIALGKQELLRTYLRKDGGKLVEPAVGGSMRKSEPRSRSGSSNIVETANLFRGTDQHNDLNTCLLYPAKYAASPTIGPIEMVETAGPDQEAEDNERETRSAQINNQEADHDAFSRELVRIFNQSIGEDPGGPSGFLGNIDGHGMPGDDIEVDVAMLDVNDNDSCEKRWTNDEVLITVESDSDLEETFIEISKEGPSEDLNQMARGATVAFGFTDDTLDRLRPGVRLKDTTILDMLKTMLPETAEPLIARWAITNFPISGLVRGFVASSRPSPMLRHNITSTHLFLVYNVVFGTVDCDSRGNGNHWILVVVDFMDPRVHVFGTENELELQADALALNVGTFVNNYRIDQGEDTICWSKPQNHPVSQYE